MSEEIVVKIISLDVSSTCTGYSQFIVNFNTKNITHVNTDSIKSSRKELYARFQSIEETFKTKGLYSWCDICVFENYAFKGNRVTQLAELNGVLKYNYFLNQKPIEILAPNSIKKLVTGNGRAKKHEVKQALLEMDLFKDLKFKNDDESDSLAVGYAYILKTLTDLENLKNEE